MTLIPRKLLAAIATLAIAATPALHAQSASASALSPANTIMGGGPEDYADEDDQLVGSINGNQYVSPTGAFRVTIPILPELGGQINDNPNVVTFQDAYGQHVSIVCIAIDDNLRTEQAKHAGRKEFLVWFFQNFIQTDFARSLPGTSVEPNAKYINNTQGGTLVTQLLLPNGSVFAERVFIFPPNPPHVAKRGNYVFINNNNIYVLSTELSERVFEYSTYKKTVAEEEDMLRQRLNELLVTITFNKNAAPASTGTAAPAKMAPASTSATGTPEVPTIVYPGVGTPTPSGTLLK